MLADAVSLLLLILVALTFGSFLGVVIKRLPAGRPVMLGRSECELCHRPLTWRDLVPLGSWIFTQGRCRYCGQRIGGFYPIVEIAALVITVWAGVVLPGWIAWVGTGLGWTLLALAWIDAEHGILPDELTLPLLIAGLIVAWFIEPGALPHHAIGAAAGCVFFVCAAWLYRRFRQRDGLGLGDAKLLGALGAWVTWQGLPTVIVYAAISGLVLVAIRAARGRPLGSEERLSFGPHLCLGGWLVWLYGPLVHGHRLSDIFGQ
jgi:leader peptidase (prepilin peptidase)/N-methyltransferase